MRAQRATEVTRQFGATTSHIYSAGGDFCREADASYHDAGAPWSINLTGMPINSSAADSDHPETALKRASNACLSDFGIHHESFSHSAKSLPCRRAKYIAVLRRLKSD